MFLTGFNNFPGFTSAYYVLASIVIAALMFGIMMLYLMSRKAKQVSEKQERKSEAIIELRSGRVAAFDFPSEAVCYTITDFVPGRYRIPLTAIEPAPDSVPEDRIVLVDLGAIILIDAEYEGRLREIEDQQSKGGKFPASGIADHQSAMEKLGIQFDSLDTGDGGFILDPEQIERIDDTDV